MPPASGGRRAGCSRTPAAPRSEDPVRARPSLLFPSWLCVGRVSQAPCPPAPGRGSAAVCACGARAPGLASRSVSRALGDPRTLRRWGAPAPRSSGASCRQPPPHVVRRVDRGARPDLHGRACGGAASAQETEVPGAWGPRPRTAQRQAGPSGRRAGAPTHVEPAPDAEGGQQGGRVERSARVSAC